MRTVIYARLSRNRDGESTSIDRQIAACKGRLEGDWTVVDTYTDDDVSAYSGKVRPAFERLLKAAGDGSIDLVVSYALDRLGRRPQDIERLLATGVRFVTVRDSLDSKSAAAELFVRILSAVAKMESDNTAARVRLKHDELRSKGKWSGGRVPYGWRDSEAQNINDAAQRILNGEGLQGIADDWGKDATFVKRTLVSPRMIGKRRVKGGLSDGAGMPAILDETTWRKVTTILLNPARRTSFDTRKKHLLAGLLTCGLCGKNLLTHTKAGAKVASQQRRYQCLTTHGGCGKVSINAQPVESLVYQEWVAFTGSDRFREWMAEAIGATERRDEDRQAIQIALESDREALYGLMDRYTSHSITLNEWERARPVLVERINAAERQLSDEPKPFDPSTKAYALSGDPKLAEGLWEAATTDERRKELSDAFPSIEVMPAVVRGRRFDPSRVRFG